MLSGFQTIDSLSATTSALFLDFDGTLADIASHPERASINPISLNNLARIHDKLEGALAIVTGRDIATLDRFLAPHVFPVSGVHGFEQRSADGAIRTLQADGIALARVEKTLALFVESHDGLLLERKPGSVAVHYRQRPDLAESSRLVVESAIGEGRELRALHGKMVIEIKAHEGNKGSAITAFLKAAPFRFRKPVFIGDDVTDEAGFEVVNARHGFSIKVGEGETRAAYHLKDALEVGAWLGALADKLDRQSEG